VDPTPLAGKVLDRLVTPYGAAADATKAAAMRAYLRDRSPFLGIRTTERRALSRRVLAGLPRPDEDDLRTGPLACWALPEREYRYFACDWLRRHAAVCTPGFLATARSW
jgi:3-methyladenine DNA glycosylase AlkD